MPESPDITFFAKTNFRNREVPFGIKTDDRRRHMYVIGKTGMGKTTMMENMVIQDIRNGHGVAFLDPHGDSIQKILDFIPSSRVNDVIYFNPADLEHPIAFNILEAVESRYKHLVASGLMGVFTKIWANMWSARMEYILNNTILALLESPGNTMLGIVRMYVDKKYRKKIIDNVKDPMVKSFWMDEFANYAEKYRTEAVAPIQNKVGQFLSSSIIRNIVGQPKSTIDLRYVMDNQKILLMDLSKGKMGEDNSALLGAMIITKMQLAALSRVDIPEPERKDFYLYVDEFQNFVTDSFATILSEARKYRLNLTVGHQYIGQLVPDRGNTKVRDAVFGNVGTIVVFRVGAEDAEFMETEFAPLFTPNDIVNLPKYHIILRLMINGVASDPFSATTLPADDVLRAGNAEKVIKVSRERYSNKRPEVEEKISRWMGAEFHEQSAMLVGQEDAGSLRSVSPEGGVQDERVSETVIAPLVMPEQPSREDQQSLAASAGQAVESIIAGQTDPDNIPKISIEPTKVATPPGITAAIRPQPPVQPRDNDGPRGQGGPRQLEARPGRFDRGGSGSSGGGDRRQGPHDRRGGASYSDSRSSDRPQRSNGPRRSYDRDQRRDERPQRFDRSATSDKSGRPPARKPNNPIWQTAGKLREQKDHEIATNLANALGSAFNNPAPAPQAPPQPPAEPEETQAKPEAQASIMTSAPSETQFPQQSSPAPTQPNPEPAEELSVESMLHSGSSQKTVIKPGDVHKF